MSSKYKTYGPINGLCKMRDYKRWVLVFHDGYEMTLNRKRYAIMIFEAELDAGRDIHLFEETVIRTIGIGLDEPAQDSFRIDITERIKYEIMLKTIK